MMLEGSGMSIGGLTALSGDEEKETEVEAMTKAELDAYHAAKKAESKAMEDLVNKSDFASLVEALKTAYETVRNSSSGATEKLPSWSVFSSDMPKPHSPPIAKDSNDLMEWSEKFEIVKPYTDLDALGKKMFAHLNSLYKAGKKGLPDNLANPSEGDNWMYWVGGAAAVWYLFLRK